MNRWKVAAQGRFITRVGQKCFAFEQALGIAADLRARGYADAHAQAGLGAMSRTELFRWGASLAHEFAAAFERYEFDDVTADEQRAIASCRDAFLHAERAALGVADLTDETSKR